jgi:hypothetical protein
MPGLDEVNHLRRERRKRYMKVLIINGSPRQKGNTSVALAEIAYPATGAADRFYTFAPL